MGIFYDVIGSLPVWAGVDRRLSPKGRPLDKELNSYFSKIGTESGYIPISSCGIS